MIKQLYRGPVVACWAHQPADGFNDCFPRKGGEGETKGGERRPRAQGRIPPPGRSQPRVVFLTSSLPINTRDRVSREEKVRGG
jgi:hypothetical protein